MKYSYEHELITPLCGLSIKYYLCNVLQNPLHWHRELELLFCIEGRLEIITPNGRRIMNSGDIILFNKNDVHRVVGDAKGNTTLVIQIDASAFSPAVTDISRYAFKCDSTESDGQDYTQLKKLARRFVDTLCRNEEGYYLELGAIRNYILIELMRSFEYTKRDFAQDEANDDNLRRLIRIVDYIEENCKEKISLDEIAKKNYLNPYYFSHYFHDNIGMSFRNYLTYTRICHAREVLINTKDRVLDIAMDFGFSSPQSFSRAFKKEFKMSPGEYRNYIKESSNDTASYNAKVVKEHSWIQLDSHDVLSLMDSKSYGI